MTAASTPTQSKWPPARKLAWIEQLARDSHLSALAIRLGVILATKYISAQRGYGWPSQLTLGADLGASADGIRKAVKQLVDGRHLAVRIGNGRGVATEYRPLLEVERVDQNPRQQSDLFDDKPQPDVGPFDGDKGPTTVGETPDNCLKNPRRQSGPLPLMNPTEGVPLKTRAREPRVARKLKPLPTICPTEAQIIDAQDRFNAESLPIDARLEAESFRAHHQSKASRMADWTAAWSGTWVGNAIRFARERAGRASPFRRRESFSNLDYAMEEVRRERADEG